jgi:hypothetical protein
MIANKEKLDQLYGELEQSWHSGSEEFWVFKTNEVNKIFAAAQTANDPGCSNRAWFLKTVCECHRDIFASSRLNQEKEFTKAWCLLERVEISLFQLKRNPIIEELENTVMSLAVVVEIWQKLYPYRVFISPEFVVRTIKCSICDEKFTPWTGCDHEKGKVYNGELCAGLISDAQFIGMAVVTDPVQKYSVMQPSRGDEGEEAYLHRHRIIDYATINLPDPFSLKGVLETEVREPHSKFPNLIENDVCPCKSGRSYGECCKVKSGILMPHLRMLVDEV